MEEGSTLKLIMDKGPREGETLEFRSGSVIRIGRVVRGNTIAIKDSGISSKHLSIQFDSNTVNWTLLDLDSSNGTIVNAVKLIPSQPAAINDGDTIKIGEYTSISVKIEMGEASRLRRNPRRRGRGGDSDNVVVVVSDSRHGGGGSELGLESGGDLGNDAVEVAPVKRNLRGRPRKGTDTKNEGEEVDTKGRVEVKQGREMNLRRTRSSKKKDESVDFNPTLPTVPENLTTGSDCRALENLVLAEGRKGRGRRNLRVDSSENVENDGLDEHLGREGCGGLKKVSAVDEFLPNGSSEAAGVDKREEKQVANELNPGREGGEELRKDNILKGLDFEKITLGEWFDYLEVYLPKQIYDETEAMISKMKEDAAKFHEFRLQQQNVKDKGKRPMD